jgi:hypothetical protein
MGDYNDVLTEVLAHKNAKRNIQNIVTWRLKTRVDVHC